MAKNTLHAGRGGLYGYEVLKLKLTPKIALPLSAL